MRGRSFFRLLAFSLFPQAKVQHVCLYQHHLAYYHSPSKHIHYLHLNHTERLVQVHRPRFPVLSDLAIVEFKEKVLIAMASYSPVDHHHSVDMVEMDPETMTVRPYPYPFLLPHSTPIRSCAFVDLEEDGPCLVCWSIDGVRTLHPLGSPLWMQKRHFFQVHHVTLSENSMGVLDTDRNFHLFHPDGTYRNKTLEGNASITACHFSLSARKLAVGYSDGTLCVYGAHHIPHTRCFQTTIRHVYADTKRFLVFLENGHVYLGDMKPKLPILQRWYHLYDAGSLYRIAVQHPFVVLDGDKEGLVMRRWLASDAITLPLEDDDFWNAFFRQ